MPVPQKIQTAEGVELAKTVRLADRFWTRAIGLMFRAELPEGEALYFPNCPAVHTCFMRYALDLVFVDEELRVVKVCRGVKAWRMASGEKKARHVLELPAGRLPDAVPAVGEQLVFT